MCVCVYVCVYVHTNFLLVDGEGDDVARGAGAGKELQDVMGGILPGTGAGGGVGFCFEVEFADHDGDDDQGGVEEEIGGEEEEFDAGGLFAAVGVGEVLCFFLLVGWVGRGMSERGLGACVCVCA